MPEHDTTENLDIETPEEEPQPTNVGSDLNFSLENEDEPSVQKNTDESSSSEDDHLGDEPETFDRPYVEKLRREAAESRVKAKRADDLAAALWTARVTATGRLADPTDLVMPDDADPLDEDAIAAAVDDLLERKPHLASRKPRGDVGAGATPAGGTVDLAALMRSRV